MLAVVRDSFEKIYIPTQISESLAIHMSLQAVNHQRQLEKLETRVQVLEIENTSLKKEIELLRTEQKEEAKKLHYFAHTKIIPVEFVVDDLDLRNENKEEWVSQPFYTHPHGYKMRLIVEFYGVGDGEGTTHISVFTKIERGEFDSQLDRPFQGSIAIMLMNQYCDEHLTHIVCYIYACVEDIEDLLICFA